MNVFGAVSLMYILMQTVGVQPFLVGEVSLMAA